MAALADQGDRPRRPTKANDDGLTGAGRAKYGSNGGIERRKEPSGRVRLRASQAGAAADSPVRVLAANATRPRPSRSSCPVRACPRLGSWDPPKGQGGAESTLINGTKHSAEFEGPPPPHVPVSSPRPSPCPLPSQCGSSKSATRVAYSSLRRGCTVGRGILAGRGEGGGKAGLPPPPRAPFPRLSGDSGTRASVSPRAAGHS